MFKAFRLTFLIALLTAFSFGDEPGFTSIAHLLVGGTKPVDSSFYTTLFRDEGIRKRAEESVHQSRPDLATVPCVIFAFQNPDKAPRLLTLNAKASNADYAQEFLGAVIAEFLKKWKADGNDNKEPITVQDYPSKPRKMSK